jgi:hypothetical protein
MSIVLILGLIIPFQFNDLTALGLSRNELHKIENMAINNFYVAHHNHFILLNFLLLPPFNSQNDVKVFTFPIFFFFQLVFNFFDSTRKEKRWKVTEEKNGC